MGKAVSRSGVILFANANRVVSAQSMRAKIPPLHLEVRVAVDDLTFQLEHQDADGLCITAQLRSMPLV